MAVIECRDRACTAEIKNGGKPCVNPTISFEGAVLMTYERNGYDDSDFYAIVWDEATGNFKHVEYASTRGWTYHNNAKVDATPEVIAKAEIRLAEILGDIWIEQRKREALIPTKGQTVESLTTRGKNKGLTGVVMWRGEDSYRSTRWLTVYRVGIKVEGEDKLRYLAEDKIRVVNPPEVDEAEVRERAAYRASEHGWRYHF